MSPGKVVAWNFRNILEPCGTLEFRRPPQVIEAKSTCHWIAFGLSFVSYALSCDFSKIKSASGYTNFQKCIHQNACHLGVESALSDWHTMAQTIQISELTSEDKAQVAEQKRQKQSHFVQKVCRTSFQNVLQRLNSAGLKCSP